MHTKAGSGAGVSVEEEKMREALLLKELLYVSQQALMARLNGEDCPEAGNLLAHLFAAGKACGLNEKEVTQALLEPAKGHLRPVARRS